MTATRVTFIGVDIAVILACIVAGWVWHERMKASSRGRHAEHLPIYIRRQHWRNYWWCQYWQWANIAIAGMFVYLAYQGYVKDASIEGVISVVWFAIVWFSALATALWDWWAVGTVARIRDEEIARLKEQSQEGC